MQMKKMWNDDFEEGYALLAQSFLEEGRHDKVDTGHWQALKDVPMTQTRELRGLLLKYDIPETIEELQKEVKPNLPWAEDHFMERVSGQPLNPGNQYKNWPWYRGNVETHKAEGEFSHTYMERYWPVFDTEGEHRQGVRYRYGDLEDVVNLLIREPTTRQAYLPVWFPEDTGATHQQRVPCSLGYHFLLREGRLHCFYSMRSCDFVRYLRDDLYLTSRLVQWVLEVVQLADFDNPSSWDTWKRATPGELSMTISSLHIFEGDVPKLEREYGNA